MKNYFWLKERNNPLRDSFAQGISSYASFKNFYGSIFE